MAASGLELAYADYRLAVAHFMGYGQTVASWSTEQAAVILVCLNRGLRGFYHPPLLPPELRSALNLPAAIHQWSFLRPSTKTLVTVVDQQAYTPGDDFGGIIGDITFADDEGIVPIVHVSESFIRKERMARNGSGTPFFFAVRPVVFVAATGQRYEILLHPEPSSVWTLTYKSMVLAEPLTSTNIYARGGEIHSETIMQSMVAAAEKYNNDVRGVEWDAYMERLASSIDSDRRELTAKEFGENRDYSDGRDTFARHATGTGDVTVGGIQY